MKWKVMVNSKFVPGPEPPFRHAPHLAASHSQVAEHATATNGPITCHTPRGKPSLAKFPGHNSELDQTEQTHSFLVLDYVNRYKQSSLWTQHLSSLFSEMHQVVVALSNADDFILLHGSYAPQIKVASGDLRLAKPSANESAGPQRRWGLQKIDSQDFHTDIILLTSQTLQVRQFRSFFGSVEKK